MGNARILVVEDEIIVAKDIQQTLTRLGYDVPAIATSGAAAIAQAAAVRPDLVLMDIRLRGEMDGITAAQAIRTQFGIPVVYVTAHSDTATLQRVQPTAPYGYVLKPFNERELYVAVETALYRHTVEDKLKRMEQWLATTLKSIGDAVIATDAAGRITFLNPIAEALTGWTQAEALGRQLSEVFVALVAPSQTRIENPVARVLQEGMVIDLAPNTYLVARDGREIAISDSAAPIRDEVGMITGVVVVFRDVTEHKRLETQLIRVQKLDSIGRLAGGLAHDFNNLLTVISGHADMVLDALAPDDPARDDLDVLRKAAERAASLTRQLLAFARKQILEPRVLDLNAIVLDLEPLLCRLLGADIDLITLPASDLDCVRVDLGQIEQVLMNLAANARDAMPDGGKLTIETQNVVLDQGYAEARVGVRSGAYVMLAVSDTGIGMDQATQQQIFEPFFTTKAVGRGTGLGLATCYGIIKQHGGNIWVYSEVGHGTTFKIYLPRVAEAAEPVPQPDEPQEMPRGTEVVLLVEDDLDVRSLAARVLRGQGYSVLEADNGRAALQVIQARPSRIDLLVTDVVMPEMSGKALVEHLADHYPGIRVLFISGYTDRAIVYHTRLEPAAPFLQKPFTPRALAQKVREALEI